MIDISAPFICEIAVTSKCNLDCVYCYARGFPSAEMDYQFCNQLVAEMIERGVFVVVLAGGEPFTHPNVLEIIDFCSIRFGDRISILTNGVALSEDVIFRSFSEMIKSNYKTSGRKINIQVSLDSVSPELNNRTRGRTEEIITVIEKLMELPVNLALGTVITTLNLKEPAKIIHRFYPKIRTFHHMMLVLTPTNRHLSHIVPDQMQMSELKKDLLLLRSKMRHLRLTGLIKELGPSIIGYPGCLAGVTRLYIDSHANVKPCCMASNYVLGNLNTQSFEDIWFKDSTERIRNESIPLCHINK